MCPGQRPACDAWPGMPLLFDEDGTDQPFPMPAGGLRESLWSREDQPLPPVKPRGRNREAFSEIGSQLGCQGRGSVNDASCASERRQERCWAKDPAKASTGGVAGWKSRLRSRSVAPS